MKVGQQAGFCYLHLSLYSVDTHFHETEVLLFFSSSNIFSPSKPTRARFIRPLIFELWEEKQCTNNLQNKKFLSFLRRPSDSCCQTSATIKRGSSSPILYSCRGEQFSPFFCSPKRPEEQEFPSGIPSFLPSFLPPSLPHPSYVRISQFPPQKQGREHFILHHAPLRRSLKGAAH